MIGGKELTAVEGNGGVEVWTENDAGELGVHGDERIAIDEVTDEFELGVEIRRPYLTILDGFGFGILRNHGG